MKKTYGTRNTGHRIRGQNMNRPTNYELRTTSYEQSAQALYVHIPFCRSKCGYCHFYSVASSVERQMSKVALYFEQLKVELAEYKGKAGSFSTIYFGGGTPSLAASGLFFSFLEFVDREFGIGLAACESRVRCPVSRVSEAEISIEANPEGISLEYLKHLRAAGVNRISIGCQSFIDGELKTLGRRHNAAAGLGAVKLARRAGFGNINVDLMGGIPGTCVEDLLGNCEQAIALGVEHISIYLLDRKEDAAFLAGKGWEEEEELRGLEMVRAVLVKAGYCNYELSNYARPGFACRHNLVYWRGGDYIGLGPTACSLLSGKRYKNQASLRGYLDEPGKREEEFLDSETRRREKIMLGLRLQEGLSLKELSKVADGGGRDFRRRVARLEKLGLLAIEGHRLMLTAAGQPLADRVMVELF